MDIQGKRVIVTGGVRGLGRMMVDLLVAQQALVTVLDLNASGLARLQECHREVNCIECDITRYEQIDRVLRTYHDVFGAAEILINNAGVLHSEPLISITASGISRHSIDNWNRVLAADLSSVFYVTSCVVEKMVVTRTKGVIVNISSVSSSGNAGQSAYSASKAGVNALTAVWAKELGPLGIRVIGVAPGFTETESTRAALSDAVLRETIKKVPLRRLGKPEEIADGVLSVIRNDFFNGKTLELDGGLIV